MIGVGAAPLVVEFRNNAAPAVAAAESPANGFACVAERGCARRPKQLLRALELLERDHRLVGAEIAPPILKVDVAGVVAVREDAMEGVAHRIAANLATPWTVRRFHSPPACGAMSLGRVAPEQSVPHLPHEGEAFVVLDRWSSVAGSFR